MSKSYLLSFAKAKGSIAAAALAAILMAGFMMRQLVIQITVLRQAPSLRICQRILSAHCAV